METLEREHPRLVSNMRAVLGDDPRQTLTQLHLIEGLTVVEISSLIGRHPDTVVNWINFLDVSRDYDPNTKLYDRKIYRSGGFNSEALMREFLGENPKDELDRLSRDEGLGSSEIAVYLQTLFPNKKAPSEVTIKTWRHKLGIALRWDPVQSREPTPRQLGILRLMSDGLTIKEIGEELGLSHSGVKSAASTIYKRLRVKNRYQAVAEATRKGLI